MKAYYNDVEFEYRLGEELNNVGAYRFVFTDAAGNTTEYNFEILYSLNASAVIFIGTAALTLTGVITLITVMRKRKKFKAKRTARRR
jgi:hypothetical protein